MKKIFKLLLCIFPWFLGGLIFKTDTLFYKNLNKPFFAPSPIIFPIVWSILFILIGISVFKIYSNYNYKETQAYNKALLINYFFNQIFNFTFFVIKSPFIALVNTILVLISSLFLYYETKELNKKAAYLLIPYIIWNIFASILIISIFFLNI